jgi:hypothetical protein
VSEKLTKAQRDVLQHIADNRCYGSRRDFREHRRDVVERVWFAGLALPPAFTESRTWELTPAGRAALSDPSTGEGP